MEYELQIRSYLAENLLYTEDVFQYDSDTSFIGQGLIDSTGVMELVMFVQSAFGVTVDPMEVTLKNFDSVNKVVAFIRNKQFSMAQAGD